MIEPETLAHLRLDDDGCPHPPAQLELPVSFTLGCVVKGEPDRVHFNALRFATVGECEDYGRDLYSRWMMLEHWIVERTSDPVSHRMVDGRPFSIASLEDRSNG